MSEQPDIAVVASAATSTGAISAEVAVDAYVRTCRRVHRSVAAECVRVLL